MQDYPSYVVSAALEYWENLESIKCKITPTLQANEYPISTSKDEEFYLEPGHTLWNRGIRTTRVARNSNAIIERLCDLTADIEMARRAVLSPLEDMCLMAMFMGYEIPVDSRTIARDSFEKVLVYLNR